MCIVELQNITFAVSTAGGAGRVAWRHNEAPWTVGSRRKITSTCALIWFKSKVKKKNDLSPRGNSGR